MGDFFPRHMFWWDVRTRDEQPGGDASFQNPAEARIVLGLAQAMVDCGISGENIVVLTPYRAQLGALYAAKSELVETRRRRLCKLLGSAASGLLFPRGGAAGGGGTRMFRERTNKRQKFGSAQNLSNDFCLDPEEQRVLDIDERVQRELDMITITPLDGFQGSERDHVLVSMVRSNAEGRCGFLKNELHGALCRRTVMQSRARQSFCMVGDRQCFEYTKTAGGTVGSQVWKQGLLDEMARNKSVSANLKMVCPVHEDSKAGIKLSVKEQPAASTSPAVANCCIFPVLDPLLMDHHPPSGNQPLLCKEVCGGEIPGCGHFCRLPCHAGRGCPRERCEEKIIKNCPKDPKHPKLMSKCNETLQICKVKIEFGCGRCGAVRQRECWQDEDFVPCKKLVECPRGEHDSFQVGSFPIGHLLLLVRWDSF